MKFQKAVALVSLIMAAVCCVYALIFMTDMADMAYYTTTQNGKEAFSGVDDLYSFANGINGALLVMAIVFLLISVTLYITASNKRRNYYVTNYVSIIATAAFAVVVAIFGIAVISVCVAKYAALDHAKYLELHNTWRDSNRNEVISAVSPGDGWSRRYPYYTDSPAMFIIGYVLNLLVLGVAALNVLNLIWKIKLMKGEKALLQQGFVKEVA